MSWGAHISYFESQILVREFEPRTGRRTSSESFITLVCVAYDSSCDMYN